MTPFQPGDIVYCYSSETTPPKDKYHLILCCDATQNDYYYLGLLINHEIRKRYLGNPDALYCQLEVTSADGFPYLNKYPVSYIDCWFKSYTKQSEFDANFKDDSRYHKVGRLPKVFVNQVITRLNAGKGEVFSPRDINIIAKSLLDAYS